MRHKSGRQEYWVTIFLHVKPCNIYLYMIQKEKKVLSFSNLGIEEKLLKILQQKGFNVPTPIQYQIIPGAIERKNVIGIAQTGTGKTLAFAIPMVQNLLNKKGQGLILAPTRELALQINETLKQTGSDLGLRLATLIGGVPQHSQVRSLKQNPHIIIATPGRLADLMNQRLCNLDNINIVTLDEADRMLDMGFLPEIKKILKTIKKIDQMMMFSATMPKSISLLASEFMKMPLRIEVSPQGTSVENTQQELFVINKDDKLRLLDSILEQNKGNKILIFSRTKFGAKKIAAEARNMGHTATEIHSDRSQNQRKNALDGFKNGRFNIMVATDIAARGIDVKDISLVVNFDLPDNSEDYVHRIGRTGRAGRAGKAISFVSPSQKADVLKIERLIRKSLPILKLPELPEKREKVFVRNDYGFSKNNSSNFGRKRYGNQTRKFNGRSNNRRRGK